MIGSNEFQKRLRSYYKNIFAWQLFTGVLVLIVVGLIIDGVVKSNAIQQLKEHSFRVSVPSKLQYGSTLETGKISDYEIYQFAGSMNQIINTWNQNGSKECIGNISKYRAYLTRNYLKQRYEKCLDKEKKRELQGRIRKVSPMLDYTDKQHCGLFQPHCVKEAEDGNGWIVWLDLRLTEDIPTRSPLSRSNEQPDINDIANLISMYRIKDKYKRIPLRVIYENDDPSNNERGLKLAHEFDRPDETVELKKPDSGVFK